MGEGGHPENAALGVDRALIKREAHEICHIELIAFEFCEHIAKFVAVSVAQLEKGISGRRSIGHRVARKRVEGRERRIRGGGERRGGVWHNGAASVAWGRHGRGEGGRRSRKPPKSVLERSRHDVGDV